ncbi:hypothetical protein PA598K_03986 [Paenibacillus sp. 598K]|uniref:helix-turn-helix transcriptional regulator n=1 Tax=Paenibacillus sp. 598K TaxID=1117987 RepID=UPI000FF912D9|nr:AraC family transcriptional regulator [Paenibacillus sp. 598K]GBF75568.1 hypothetical protein PA598K_03986 [Paenibacillus sp. 598K]
MTPYQSDRIVCTLGGHKEPNLHRWGPGIRDIYALHYIVSGRGTLVTRGVSHPVGPGESFVIFPHTEVYYYPDRDDPWAYVWIEYKGEEAERLMAATCLTPDAPVTGPADRDLSPLFDIMENGNVLPHEKLRSVARLQLLLSYYIEQFPNASLARQTDYVWAAKEYIHHNYWRSGVKVADVVRSVAIERSYLFRLFREATGMSVSAYLTSYRMSRAASLLAESGLAIQAVAYSVGYQDPLYFSRAFKKTTSHTPTEYRRLHRTNDRASADRYLNNTQLPDSL